MTVIVYTASSCMPCRLTKRAMRQRCIDYTELDAQAHADHLRELGMRELPVVIADDMEPWCGFRPDLIAKIEGLDV